MQFLQSNHRIRESFPFFDGRKNLYTTHRISGLVSKTEFACSYRETDREDPRDTKFRIEIQPTGEVEIDLSTIETYIENGSSVDTPGRAIQALGIALRNGAVNRKIIIGKLFVFGREGASG